jgi:hypothetical protein
MPKPSPKGASLGARNTLATPWRGLKERHVNQSFGATHLEIGGRGFKDLLLHVGNQPHANEASVGTRT